MLSKIRLCTALYEKHRWNFSCFRKLFYGKLLEEFLSSGKLNWSCCVVCSIKQVEWFSATAARFLSFQELQISVCNDFISLHSEDNCVLRFLRMIKIGRRLFDQFLRPYFPLYQVDNLLNSLINILRVIHKMLSDR